MSILKIVAVTLLASLTTVECSVPAHAHIHAVAPLPAIRYTQVAPPSVLPFSAQVSTFTRNLHVFDAPYAAGVIPGHPAIVQRALPSVSAAPFASAPVLPAPVAPVPAFPAPIAPTYARVAPAYPGVAPVWPYAGPAAAPVLPYAGPAAAPVFPYAGGFVAPEARSVHAW